MKREIENMFITTIDLMVFVVGQIIEIEKRFFANGKWDEDKIKNYDKGENAKANLIESYKMACNEFDTIVKISSKMLETENNACALFDEIEDNICSTQYFDGYIKGLVEKLYESAIMMDGFDKTDYYGGRALETINLYIMSFLYRMVALCKRYNVKEEVFNNILQLVSKTEIPDIPKEQQGTKDDSVSASSSMRTIDETEIRKLFFTKLSKTENGKTLTYGDKLLSSLRDERTNPKDYARVALIMYESQHIDTDYYFCRWLAKFYDLMGIERKTKYNQKDLRKGNISLRKEFYYLI